MGEEVLGAGADIQSASLTRFRDQLPPDMWESLTPVQRGAIARAMAGRPWTGHPVNIRLSLPMLGPNLYLTLVAGWERRQRQRRVQDRGDHPLRTLGNLIFAGAAALLFFLLWVVAALVVSSIVEF